ncbi:hypothetical protein NPIL_554831 [Nephila pilipes]|uniref:RING-type domain-containing protein n=1 Tax=Nephila pilipes TaxID=299642 RepID=A0A8X6MYT7_NEPPI|nr:hypothetical protein NPIL_554831 [Nephila pilipes]
MMICKKRSKRSMKPFCRPSEQNWENKIIPTGPVGLGSPRTPNDCPWIKLSQTVLDSFHGDQRLNTIFDNCAIYLQTIHWTEKTICGHVFHLQRLMRHMSISNTCPLCRHPNPLQYDNDDEEEDA